jgi:hypothetical protein
MHQMIARVLIAIAFTSALAGCASLQERPTADDVGRDLTTAEAALVSAETAMQVYAALPPCTAAQTAKLRLDVKAFCSSAAIVAQLHKADADARNVLAQAQANKATIAQVLTVVSVLRKLIPLM